jgi:hypothetical protein
MKRKIRYQVGDRVVVRATPHRTGTIVHVYKEPPIRDQLVAIRLDGSLTPLAYHINDIRKSRIGRRRRGRQS